ncbi:MAG: right-handed parallel beta-helix repeat-containing protein [Candidatus Bathyarchaeia archaeon]|jgi:nitrous oxidase accessory protein NosD
MPTMGSTNKTVALLLTAVCLILAMLPYTTVKAQPQTIIVPDDYTTIQSAIDHANDGDSILVKAGTYEEQTLNINKSISLNGEGLEKTTISLHPPWIFKGYQFGGKTGLEPVYGYDNPIKIIANNIQLSGFKIISNQTSDITVSGNGTIITGNEIAIGLFLNNIQQNLTGNYISSGLTCSGNSHIISNNIIIDGLYALAQGVTITNNTFSGKYGIMMGESRNSVINNTIQDTACAIYFWMGASDNEFYLNNFINNSVQVQIGEVSNPTVARWDNGEIGNYWSNHAGQGPYAIDENNIDHHPLTQPVALNLIAPTPTSSTGNLVSQLTIPILAVAGLVVIIISLLLLRRHRKTAKLKQ